MTPKPTDFFINVTDFFSVLLPGALVVYFLKGSELNTLFGNEGMFLAPQTKLQGWLLFLLATYIIGHIIFLLGSLLMDKLVYNQFLRNRLFKKNYDLAYHAATINRDSFIPTDTIINKAKGQHKISDGKYQKIMTDPKREILNTYKWTLHHFTLYQPEVLFEVKKLEADSKFFRSLVIAFLFIGIVLVFQVSGYALLFFVLALLSVYRYGELRYKSSEKAYELVVTKFHDQKLNTSAMTPAGNEVMERFRADKKKEIDYKSAIDRITAGHSGNVTLLSIDKDSVMRSQSTVIAREFYCIEGSGFLDILENNGADKSILSPGAIINVPPSTTYKISTQNEQPLLLLLVA